MITCEGCKVSNQTNVCVCMRMRLHAKQCVSVCVFFCFFLDEWAWALCFKNCIWIYAWMGGLNEGAEGLNISLFIIINVMSFDELHSVIIRTKRLLWLVFFLHSPADYYYFCIFMTSHFTNKTVKGAALWSITHSWLFCRRFYLNLKLPCLCLFWICHPSQQEEIYAYCIFFLLGLFVTTLQASTAQRSRNERTLRSYFFFFFKQTQTPRSAHHSLGIKINKIKQ